MSRSYSVDNGAGKYKRKGSDFNLCYSDLSPSSGCVAQHAGRKFETQSEKGGSFSSKAFSTKRVSEIRKWTIPGSVKLST